MNFNVCIDLYNYHCNQYTELFHCPQTLSYFSKMQDRIINFVTENSAVKEEKLRELMMNTKELVMDVGSVVDGPEAVDIGLIDSLGSLSDAIECLYSIIENSEKRYPDDENTEQ